MREIFSIIAELRAAGVSILLVEQNARAALQISDYGYVLETGELALEGPSAELAANPRVAATYLGQAVAGSRRSPGCSAASASRACRAWARTGADNTRLIRSAPSERRMRRGRSAKGFP